MSSRKELIFLDRTLRIPWFDRERMKETNVTVVGAGNIGSQLLLALYGLGLRRIVIIDHDVVELSNVQRQVVYSERDVGRPKVHVAVDFLRSRFSGLSTELRGVVHDARYMQFPESDYLFCCVDNDEARKAILEHCLENGIPLFDMGSGVP